MDKAKYEPNVNDIIYVKHKDGNISMYKVCKFVGLGEHFVINRTGYLWAFKTFLERMEGKVVLVMRNGSCAYDSSEGEIEFVPICREREGNHHV